MLAFCGLSCRRNRNTPEKTTDLGKSEDCRCRPILNATLRFVLVISYNHFDCIKSKSYSIISHVLLGNGARNGFCKAA